jgi:hypothetical protein
MLKKIESLRERPKHIRNAYAFWISLSVTLLIAFLWSTTLPAKFSGTVTSTSSAQTVEQGSSFFHTLGELKDSVITTFANMRTTTQYVREAKPEEQVDPNVLDLKKIYEESLKKAKTSSSTDVTATSTPAGA